MTIRLFIFFVFVTLILIFSDQVSSTSGEERLNSYLQTYPYLFFFVSVFFQSTSLELLDSRKVIFQSLKNKIETGNYRAAFCNKTFNEQKALCPLRPLEYVFAIFFPYCSLSRSLLAAKRFFRTFFFWKNMLLQKQLETLCFRILYMGLRGKQLDLKVLDLTSASLYLDLVHLTKSVATLCLGVYTAKQPHSARLF